uniref:Uncharacterized protein n=1 Tax=Siphoviridae sp. ctvok7 TaxID=2827596 RepID=A0A8S5LLZ5_9CAUD|nr:MAG TPA: hypothetical protein [Siphoviridae sp. ctvok7]
MKIKGKIRPFKQGVRSSNLRWVTTLKPLEPQGFGGFLVPLHRQRQTA